MTLNGSQNEDKHSNNQIKFIEELCSVIKFFYLSVT